MGIHDSEDMVSFLKGQPRDNGRITGLEAFWGTPTFLVSKGTSKRWQSSEDLWLSEPNNQLQEGRQGPEWGGSGVCTGSFSLIWKGKDKGESAGAKTAVGDTLSNIIPYRFYSLKQSTSIPSWAMGNHGRVGAGGIDHTGASWLFTPGLSDTKPTFPPHHTASRSLFLQWG